MTKRRRNNGNGRTFTKKTKQTFRRKLGGGARTGGFLGLELKFLDCAWNSVVVSASTDGANGEMQPSSGCTNAISVPAQGDGESQRDGRKYVMKSVWVSGIIATSASAAEAGADDIYGYYFALVLDTQCNKATIVSENVYDNPSTISIGILPQPLRNLENSSRYRILASQYVAPGGAYAFNDAAATASISNQVGPTVNLSWRGSINVETAGTTADVASATNNAIHVLAYAGGTQLTPVFIGKSRMRFMG